MDLVERSLGSFRQMGGPGSGHHGHRGRKGKRGGSTPSRAGALPVKGAGRATFIDVNYVRGVVDEVVANLPESHLEGFDVVAVRSAKYGKAGKVGQESDHIQIPRRDASDKPLSRSELKSLVRHEIGHQVFKRKLTTDQRQDWTKAGKQIRLGVTNPKVRQYFPWLEDASQMKVSPNLRDLSFGGELFAELYDGYYGYKKSAIKELFPARFRRLETLPKG